MQTIHLLRDPSTDDDTTGQLIGMDFTFDTLERPWADNHPDKSCIPEGLYDMRFLYSDHFAKIFPDIKGSPVGMCYHIMDVPGRMGILIHNANRAEQLLGCIAIGQAVGVMPDSTGKPVTAVLRSKDAIMEFHRLMAGEPAKLEVNWRTKP